MSTHSFEVLDRNTDIKRSYLLEASAGTGKTFAIENLYIRLLLETSSKVDNILVVTFTRAATKELKTRIRKNISHNLTTIRLWLLEKESEAPDYLLKLKESGSECLLKAKRKLEQALLDFDKAEIYTIHSFCEKMLKQYAYHCDQKEALGAGELIEKTKMLSVIRDFFRTGLTPVEYSPGQLKIVLKKNIDQLEKEILHTLEKAVTIAPSKGFQESFNAFCSIMQNLIKTYPDSEKILDDIGKLSPCYKKICNRQEKISDENFEIFTEFASLFQKNNWSKEEFDFLLLTGKQVLALFSEDNRKCKAVLPNEKELWYPSFFQDIHRELTPLLENAGSYEIIFSRMVNDCQEILRKVLEQNEKFRHDDLLERMWIRVKEKTFANEIQKKFAAAIIDEFQDTDPIQWSIFKELFSNKEKIFLYLVGDPKQSIYGFRQADIYTYLNAAKTLGQEHIASLDTNYRSDPSLVHALNTLFCNEDVSEFISLPKSNSFLSYQKVNAKKMDQERILDDGIGRIHFFSASGKKGRGNWPSKELSTQYFYPYILSEIIRQKKEMNISFGSWAILVRDRYQADDIAHYCRQANVPVRLQRQRNLSESKAVEALDHLFECLLNPRDISALKKVLGGVFVRLDHHQIREMDQEDELVFLCTKMESLRAIAKNNGLAGFFAAFFQSKWKGKNVRESILSSSIELYHDCVQLLELIIDYQYENRATLSQCASFLQDIEKLSIDEDERLRSLQDNEVEAVKILSIHMSKGLEFDFVVPIGLISRPPLKEKFIAKQQGDKRVLFPLTKQNTQEFEQFCREVDAEKMRQLYVAMTRAKHRLYVPVAIEESAKTSPNLGKGAPLEIFLSLFSTSLKEWVETKAIKDGITYQEILEPPAHPRYETNQEKTVLRKPPDIVINKHSQTIHSFTSLAKQKQSISFNLLENDDFVPPHDFQELNKNSHTLPAGAEVGILLHNLLEKISFQDFTENKRIITQTIVGTKFDEWQCVIEEILFTTLTAKIIAPNGSFFLRDIAPHNLYREAEFLFSDKKNKMYLKGVIDLCFSYEGRYYLLDWKSNWLGPNKDFYTKINMENAVKQHHYGLQAMIYKNAFQKYISLFDSRPIEECFGGIIYIFLRGIEKSGTQGVYFIDNDRVGEQI